jgi:hypothetical protein
MTHFAGQPFAGKLSWKRDVTSWATIFVIWVNYFFGVFTQIMCRRN